MKTSILAPIVATLLLALSGCQTDATSTAPQGKVVVNYDHPEKFTDVESSYSNGTQQGYLDNLTRYLQVKAGPYLKADQTLTITFSDVDMAGALGMNARANQTRVVRSSTPVILKFSYAVTDGAGKVVKQGNEELVNHFPNTQMGTNRNDPLFHEKEMLESWARSTLK
jgi:hypothetical protein